MPSNPSRVQIVCGDCRKEFWYEKRSHVIKVFCEDCSTQRLLASKRKFYRDRRDKPDTKPVRETESQRVKNLLDEIPDFPNYENLFTHWSRKAS